MQFHQLIAFVSVVEQKSFSKAAENIFLSQSTVSTHIASLEKYFGQKLFDRLGKKVILTPFGERLYYWAKEILTLREKALWDLKDWTGKAEGNILIVASNVPAQYIVPTIISNFLEKYPGISFTIEQFNSQNTADALVNGEADLGILGEKYYSDKIKYIPFMKEKMVLITPKHMKFPQYVSLKQLSNVNFILRKEGSGTQAFVEKLLKKRDMDLGDLKVIAHFDNVQSIKQCVKKGMGVSIISEIAADDYVKSGLINSYYIKEIDKERFFYFAYNKQKTMSPVVNELINFSNNLFKEDA